MLEHLKANTLVARPIVSPELVRTLYICEMADRPSTFPLETIRELCINLALDAVSSGRWDAHVTVD
jgi:LysR family nitrogen assimilation transcriptional regulator